MIRPVCIALLVLAVAWEIRAQAGSDWMAQFSLSNDRLESIFIRESQYLPHSGQTFMRISHRLDGVPVWNGDFSVVTDRRTFVPTVLSNAPNPDLLDKYKNGIYQLDKPSFGTSISACMAANSDKSDTFRVAKMKRYIYDDRSDTTPAGAYFVDLVGLRADDSAGEQVYELCLVKSGTTDVILSFSGIYNYYAQRWKAGNEKIGEHFYELHPFFMKEKHGTCTLESPLTSYGSVRTFNNKNSENINLRDMEPYSFTCNSGPDDEINGAYSCVLDAHHYALKVRQMFRRWIGVNKIVPSHVANIDIVCHVGHNLVNTIYNGEYIIVGDGDGTTFHPLCSRKLIAHELAHAYIDSTSAMVPDGETTCVIEAVADLIGEGIMYFMDGDNDWIAGSEVMVGDYLGYRDMTRKAVYSDYFPDCSEEFMYYDCKEGHACSVLMSYAAYKWSKQPGWNTQLVVTVLMQANRLAFTEQETIKSAGCKCALIVKNGIISETNDPTAIKVAYLDAGIDLMSECPDAF